MSGSTSEPGLRYLRAEFICPCMTNLENIFALPGGFALLVLRIRFWTDRPSRSRLSISLSFHRAKRFIKHSWWSFDFDFMLGFCSAIANKTIAMCCACDALFHSDVLC